MKKKVLYIREGAFSPYKKCADKTPQDHLDTGKKLAKKAIIDSLVKTELPKILMKALPQTIAKYRTYLNWPNKRTNDDRTSDSIGVVPISCWESREYYSADTCTFGNDWDNTGIYVDLHNGGNVNIMIPLVSKGINLSYIRLPISSMGSCNYSNLLNFRSTLASLMAPEIDELEAKMAAAGLKLDIKYYIVRADGDSDWAHVPEVSEITVNADEPFVEEQRTYAQENMRHSSDEPFSAYIKRQKYNGYGVLAELLEVPKVPRIYWNTATQSIELSMKDIVNELAILCKEFNPDSVRLIARVGINNTYYNQIRKNKYSNDTLESIVPLANAMSPNSKISMSFKFDTDFTILPYMDLEPGTALVPEKLCNELFGMSYEEALHRLVYEIGEKDIKREEGAGRICKRAYISDITIKLGSSIENSKIEVDIVKFLADASDTREEPRLSSFHVGYIFSK